jgi:nucleoid-associated protein YgaU
MKMGLGIGLLILVSVVGYYIINKGPDVPPPAADSSMTDAGSTGGDVGAVDTENDSALTDSRAPQTGFGDARRTEEERSTSSAGDRDREASDRGVTDPGGAPLTDAADAPATESEDVGSPSPSPIPAGLSGTGRPGLSDSTDATGAARAVTDAAEDAAASDVDAAATESEADRRERAGLADTGTTGSSRSSTDTGRIAPTADDAHRSASDSSTAGTPAAPVATSHTIASGDTFSGLAVRYFGHAKHAGLISDANPDIDPRRLQVGQTIKIPDTPQRKERMPAAADATSVPGAAGAGGAHSSSVETASSGTSPTVSESSLPAIPEDRQYVVKATDKGWYDLAQRLLGDSDEWTMLYEVNKERLPNPDRRDIIPVGLVIEIPELPETK